MANDVTDISADVDQSTKSSRREDRLAAEEVQFDGDYVAFDTTNEDIVPLLEFKPLSWKALKSVQKRGDAGADHDEYFVLSEREQEQLIQLSNIHCNTAI